VATPKPCWTGVIIAALVLLLGGLPSVAYAQYPDAPDLPGTMSTEEVILRGLGVAAVIIVVALIAKNLSADEPEEVEEGEGDEEGSDAEEWESTSQPGGAACHQVSLGQLAEPGASRFAGKDQEPISMCLKLRDAGGGSATRSVAIGILVAF
jgi:hypothetical protein